MRTIIVGHLPDCADKISYCAHTRYSKKKYKVIYSYSKRQVSGCGLITTRKGPSPFLSHEEEKQLQSTCMRWLKYGYFLKSDLFTDRNL